MSTNLELDALRTRWDQLAQAAAEPSKELERSLAFHEADRSGRPVPRRIERWVKTCSACESFIAQAGRLPTYAADSTSVEYALARWIARQVRDPDLCIYQVERLELIPGFSWATRLDRWRQRLADVEMFYTAFDRLPARSSQLPAERSLALWFARQRQRMARGELPHSQVDALRRSAAPSHPDYGGEDV